MNDKKEPDSLNPIHRNKKILSWKSIRALVSKTIPIELDLEKREILLNDETLKIHDVKIDSKNLDSFISQFVDPEQSQRVQQSLYDAEKGIEKPIHFCFIHPQIKKKFCFEYRYTITYVSYAKTRLKGELVTLFPKKT